MWFHETLCYNEDPSVQQMCCQYNKKSNNKNYNNNYRVTEHSAYYFFYAVKTTLKTHSRSPYTHTWHCQVFGVFFCGLQCLSIPLTQFKDRLLRKILQTV